MKLSEMPKGSDSKTDASCSNLNNAKMKSVNEAYEELKDCSSNELMQKLVKEIENQKKMGLFDYDLLMNSIDKVKPYLTNETYENMRRIIDGLK